MDFAPWLSRRNNPSILAGQGTRKTKTVVVVTVRRHIVVAVGGAEVRRFVVERTATQQAHEVVPLENQ